MRIAVNTRLLLPDKLEGLGRFACETLKRITRDHPEHEFIFIFDRKYAEEFIFEGNIIPEIAFPQARHPVLWYLFFEWGVPPILKKYKPDLFLSPDGWLSLRTDTPSLPVIHDLNFFHNPEWIQKLPLMYYRYFFPRFISKAKRIATVSEFSAHDIATRFDIDKKMIDVVFNGAGENLVPLHQSEIQVTRNKFTNGQPYFLFLGLVHPRKNLTRIIEAFNQYKRQSGDYVHLLVAGSRNYWTSDTKKAYMESPFKNEIIFCDRLTENELPLVLGSGLALVYTSLFEGFGIPILEAMRCGLPVITSDITSMPEVGGEAVLYANPFSADSIATAMMKISYDKSLQKELIRRGFERKDVFSWERTASLLWNSIEKSFP
jgi:glycosyltransferase involved in cell wall biosynthesis